MPTPYASGKYAIALCDRCGRTRKLTELKYQFLNQVNTNWLVCAEDCWEEDQPQYLIGRYPINDPQALQVARPDQRNDLGLGALLQENGAFLCSEDGAMGLLIVNYPPNLISN